MVLSDMLGHEYGFLYVYSYIINICDIKNDFICLFSDLLPGQPRDVELEPLTERSIRVSWQPPASLARTVQEYIISHVALETYDPAERKPTSTGVQIQTRVPAAQNSTVLSDLTPYTMYEVQII